MSVSTKKCNHCYFELVGEDVNRKFCPHCGEPLEKELSLAIDLDKAVKETQQYQNLKPRKNVAPPEPIRKSHYDDDDDDDYDITPSYTEEKKGHPLLIFFIIIVIIAVAAFFLLKH